MILSDQLEGQCELDCNVRLLRAYPPFGDLAPELLRVLAYLCEREAFVQGQNIMTEGESADGAVILIRGTACVEYASRRISSMTEGAHTGGLALFGQFRWVYTVRAESEAECLLLPRRKLLPQFFAQPEAMVGVIRELIIGVVKWDQQRLEGGGEVLGQGPSAL